MSATYRFYHDTRVAANRYRMRHMHREYFEVPYTELRADGSVYARGTEDFNWERFSTMFCTIIDSYGRPVKNLTTASIGYRQKIATDKKNRRGYIVYTSGRSFYGSVRKEHEKGARKAVINHLRSNDPGTSVVKEL